MKKLLLIVSCITVLSSCTSMKLTGNYPDPHYFIETSDSFDDVWSRVIDYFAYAGVPITTIEKSSGLIVSSKVSFIDHYTTEKRGIPSDPNAYVVIPNLGALYLMTGTLTITGDWNVRIKESDGKTSININLINIDCYYTSTDRMGNTTKIPAKSTGKFEQSLLDYFAN